MAVDAVGQLITLAREIISYDPDTANSPEWASRLKNAVEAARQVDIWGYATVPEYDRILDQLSVACSVLVSHFGLRRRLRAGRRSLAVSDETLRNLRDRAQQRCRSLGLLWTRMPGGRAVPGSEEPNPAENLETTLLPVMSLGDRNYQVGDETIVLEDSEDCVLQAFFRDAKGKPRWASMEKRELIRRSGYETAARILKRIQTKHPSMAHAIDCPGKRGRGGLKVYVAKCQKSRSKSR